MDEPEALVRSLGIGWVLAGSIAIGVAVAYLYLWMRARTATRVRLPAGVCWRLAAEIGGVDGGAFGALVALFSWQHAPPWLANKILVGVTGVALMSYADWRMSRVLGRRGRSLWREGGEITVVIGVILVMLLGWGTLAVEALG